MRSSFEWDDTKAAANAQRHGVTFQEASTVFENPLAVIFDDEAHSQQERREIIIGHSSSGRLLLVCFAEREETVRIISARPAAKREQRDYEENVIF